MKLKRWLSCTVLALLLMANASTLAWSWCWHKLDYTQMDRCDPPDGYIKIHWTPSTSTADCVFSGIWADACDTWDPIQYGWRYEYWSWWYCTGHITSATNYYYSPDYMFHYDHSYVCMGGS